jgi:hypothetical protein
MFTIVVADTDAMWGRAVRDHLVFAHQAGIVRLRWGTELLDEYERKETEKLTRLVTTDISARAGCCRGLHGLPIGVLLCTRMVPVAYIKEG